MLIEKGPRRIGGRAKGTPNKRTAAMKAAIAAGLTPLEYMLGILRDPTQEYDRRDEMAKAAAPYCHAKLASTEITGKDGGPVQVQITGDDAGLL